MLGDLISAGAKLLGGSMASDATKEANRLSIQQAEKAYDRAAHDKQLDRDLQIRFAQQGIQWRADDALRAGIHPLYALGANVPTYSGSPISVGTANITPDTSMGSAVASMGQDIGRAINSTRSADQRDEAFLRTSQALSLQKMGLENDLLASQIKRLQVQSNPVFPSASRAADPTLRLAGVPISTDPTTSDMQKFSDRYGDEGLPQWTIPPFIMWRDYQATTGGKGPDTSSWPEKVGSSVWEGLKWLDRNIKPFGR